MTHYTLTLINRSPDLDLTLKDHEIGQVFKLIDNGGKTGSSFKDLHLYQPPQIWKHSIEVDVEETAKSWHPWVGRILANDHGMRGYCQGVNKDRMFKWNWARKPFYRTCAPSNRMLIR